MVVSDKPESDKSVTGSSSAKSMAKSVGTLTDQNSINLKGNLRGVFGFGISNNDNLDFLNLVVLAVTGLIIKLCFNEVGGNKRKGVTGSAATTIWGYGLTAISLFIMIFLALNLNLTDKYSKKENSFHELIDNVSIMNLIEVWPILLTFLVIIYIITLNFIFYRRINSGSVSSTYNVYDTFSTILIILQIGLIIKYIYLLLNKIITENKASTENKISIIKSLSLILVTVNFIFVLIINIILAFFSTDG